MTSHRTTHEITESWIARELRERIARMGTALERQARADASQADAEPRIDREAGQ